MDSIPDLQTVTIRKSGDGWLVTLAGEDSDETMYAIDLKEAYWMIEQVYDKNGKESEIHREWLLTLFNG